MGEGWRGWEELLSKTKTINSQNHVIEQGNLNIMIFITILSFYDVVIGRKE